MRAATFTDENAERAGAIFLALQSSGCPICGVHVSSVDAAPAQVGYRVRQWLHFACGSTVVLDQLAEQYATPPVKLRCEAASGCRTAAQDALSAFLA